MRALYFDGQSLSLADRPEPTENGDEVVLDLRLAGICSTDLEITKGYMGFRGILGHEFVGTTADGARFVPSINCGCGRCDACASGAMNHCPTRTVIGIVGRDGGLAERVRVPRHTLHAVPDAVSDLEAVFTEPLAAALHVLDDIPREGRPRVCLLGDGKLGLLIGLALATQRERFGDLLALGKHPAKLKILEALGVRTALHDAYEGPPFDVVVEATGQASGLHTAFEIIKPQGRLILKSTYAGQPSVQLAPIVIHELQVVGSRCGDFGRALQLLESKAVDPTPLIAETYALASGLKAFEQAGTAGTLKILVTP